MKNEEAFSILGINYEVTAKELKSIYRNLCRKYHPDINPSGLHMTQLINSAYNHLLKIYTIDHTKISPESYTQDYGEDLSKAINIIINCNGLEIEVCGIWIWVGGNTKNNKETLKGAGFRWSQTKKLWYFRPTQDKKRYRRGNTSIDEIRNTYGSSKVIKKENSIYLN